MPGACPAARSAIASTPPQPIRPTWRRAPGSAFGHSSVAPCAFSLAHRLPARHLLLRQRERDDLVVGDVRTRQTAARGHGRHELPSVGAHVAGLLRAPKISLRERLNLPRGPAPHEIERLLIGAGECEILDLTRRGNGAQVPPLRAIDLDAIAPGVIHA